ncbi:MAG TPA: Hsp20/alpha crystallin family protein [Blastocatellia bacterium]|nr:Hsp20/alpha crystallin family protein [Blastocatellia bacterium]
MAEVNINNRNRTQATKQMEEQGQANPSLAATRTTGRGQQGSSLARRGAFAPSIFSLNPIEMLVMSPFELMRRLTDEMDRSFENLNRSRSINGSETAIWSPAVEVFERDNNLIVRAELPGLEKDNVKVEVTDDGLIIQGERKCEHEDRQEGFYQTERSYGQFYRLIPLPEGANLDQVKAQFTNGVLEISVPIPESQGQRRNIPIESGQTPAGQTTNEQTQTATGG